MGNFAFIRTEWPEIYRDCARAESYMASDPRSACFYARRAVELLVRHLYELIQLPAPYKTDLAALINDAQFTATVGGGIQQKLNLLRRVGNTAVHDSRPIPARTAVDVLRQLYDVIIWAAFNYSTRPGSVPTGSQFDPALAAKSAPLTHDQVLELARRFKEQDEALARERAASEAREAAYEAENARLREQVRQAQAAKTAVDTHDYSEAETRDLFIDVLLREAGWPLSEKRDREYPVSGLPGGGRGAVDYVLWGSDGLPLAVVEAKRTRKSAVAGQEQARQYADALERETARRPVIFYTNGYEHWLWDDAAGYPPREVRGFYTRDELELLIQRRATRRSLSDCPVSSEIAGRFYQTRAIRAINDVFDKKQREALLVMATGTGKTRTVISLADQLSRAGWVKRVLFLADRTALVTQAANAFNKKIQYYNYEVSYVDSIHCFVVSGTTNDHKGFLYVIDKNGHITAKKTHLNAFVREAKPAIQLNNNQAELMYPRSPSGFAIFDIEANNIFEKAIIEDAYQWQYGGTVGFYTSEHDAYFASLSKAGIVEKRVRHQD